VSLFRRAPILAHDSLIEVAGCPVRLRVNARARRISLRLDSRTGEVIATAPTQRRLADAARFAEQRAGWIAEQIDRLPQPAPLRPGVTLSVGGEPCRLERAAMRIAPRLVAATADEPMRLIASGDAEAYGRAALRALKAEALRRLTERTGRYAAALGQPMPFIAVSDPKSRWGSCRKGIGGAPGVIRYNWRLILTPAWVLDYVAAHEVAHLIEANHGPDYWAIVQRLYGDHRAARTWLRANAGSLHSISA
jgi:predicted metal-dependent hydrolase